MPRERCEMLAALLILCGVALAGGCRGGEELETAPVSGVVTLDGKPVGEGEVIFTPERGRPARATLAADGSFVLGTYADDDGAVLGMHRVAVIARRGEPPQELQTTSYEWLVPERFANPHTSGVTFEVQADQPNVAQLDLLTAPVESGESR